MEAAPATAAAPGWRCRPGGRLDMSHGFVRHIRRNQLARDAYDRAVRQARGRARTRLTPGPARPRRPDQQVYRPHRGGERGYRGERGNPGEPGGPAGVPAAPGRRARGRCQRGAPPRGQRGPPGTGAGAAALLPRVRGGRRAGDGRDRAPGGQRRGGDPAGVCPQPPGAPPAQGPVPARAGRAQQAPGHGVTLLAQPGTATPGHCHPPGPCCPPLVSIKVLRGSMSFTAWGN
ncbi:UPF0561 protein C2orf68 homolog isoform X1 [Agelaius tricolor]|uniref:UPF0561 protein C2orf68 homolog isoform X1 n=1 Tax=Agelaius tricolor TaxID=9191 RepID=UPI0039F19137